MNRRTATNYDPKADHIDFIWYGIRSIDLSEVEYREAVRYIERKTGTIILNRF